MANVNERRISFNKEDYEIVKRLQLEPLFKKLQLIDIFALALLYGKKQGFRTPLDKSKTGRIREKTIENSNVHYLMMALAVDEVGNFDILAKRDDYFTICEEYAKTGLSFLEADYMNNPKNFLRDLELETLRYFGDVIEPNIPSEE